MDGSALGWALNIQFSGLRYAPTPAGYFAEGRVTLLGFGCAGGCDGVLEEGCWRSLYPCVCPLLCKGMVHCIGFRRSNI